MRVKWHDSIDLPEEFWATYDGSFPLTTEQTGEVVSTVTSFFGGTRFVVTKDDGRVVEVPIDRATVIQA